MAMESKDSGCCEAMANAEASGVTNSTKFPAPKRSLGKSLFDFLTSALAIIVLSPLLLILALVSLIATGRVFTSETLLGQGGAPFRLWQFSVAERGWRLGRLPVLLSILAGRISWVGPKPYPAEHYNDAKPEQCRHLAVKPGVLSLWWLRQRGSIAFDEEWETEAEYADKVSIKTDLGIIVRSLIMLVLGGEAPQFRDHEKILGIPITNVTMNDAVEWVAERVASGRKGRVCYVNADCGNLAWKLKEYRQCLREADAVFADGIGFKLAGRVLRRPIRENLNGTDMFPRLMTRLEEDSRSVYLLGGLPEVSEAIRAYTKEHFPALSKVGGHHGYLNEETLPKVLAEINEFKPDCLLVGFGAPIQEKWIRDHHDVIDACVALGVGGLFDYYSGRIPRAPVWMREIGMEWFYRFLQEPGRLWRRYFIGNGLFLWRVWKERRTGRGPWCEDEEAAA